MTDAVIVSAVRTPVGKAPKGTLRTTRPDEMAATVIAEALRRSPGIEPAEVEDVILGVSKELGFDRRAIDDDEIQERCLYTLINEGAKILDEGLALRSSDIDVIWIYGYGFPAHRGGPMFYADQVGLKMVYEALCRLAEVHGDLFAPSPLLERLALEAKGFKDL